MEEVRLFDIKINNVNVPEVLDSVVNTVRQGQKLSIFHLNVHSFGIAFKDATFKDILNKGDIIFCDGFGVKLGARIMGLTVGERMTPPDWIDELCNKILENEISVFLIGDEPTVAEICAGKFKEKHPNLTIKGTHHGFFTKQGSENDQVIRLINECKPDVVLVGFGMPLQERWVVENAGKIDSSVFITVGALFRWYAQIEKRGPRFVTGNGFEWLWRLFVQPKKVWKRYLVELPYFFGMVLKSRFFKTK